MVIGKRFNKRWTIWDTEKKIGVKFTSKKGRGVMSIKTKRINNEMVDFVTCDGCLYTSTDIKRFIYTSEGVYCTTCGPESEGINDSL